MRLLWTIPVAVLVNVHLSDSASGKRPRLCRYDKLSQECVDIRQRINIIKPPSKCVPYLPSTQSLTKDSTRDKVLNSGKCAAKNGSCEFHEINQKLRCRCWNTTTDEEVTTGVRLCIRRKKTCSDIRIRHKRRKGANRKNQAKRKGNRRRNGQKRRKGKGKRRRERKTFRPNKPLGRCAAQGLSCVKFDESKCRCRLK